MEGRRPAPVEADGDRGVRVVEVEPREAGAHRGSDSVGVDIVDGEVELGRHHGDVADGHGLDGRDEDGAPAHLDGVLRRPHDRGADARRRSHEHSPKLHDTLPHRAGQKRAEVAVAVPVVTVDEFRDAAGEDDGTDRSLVRELRQPHQSLRLVGDTPAKHDLHEAVHHLTGDGLLLIVSERRAELDIHARLARVEAPRLFDADDAVFRVERKQARARVERGNFERLPTLADSDLAGAPANVDVHYDAVRLLRFGDRAGAVGGHRRLQTVARADGDELPGLLGEYLRDGAGVVPPDGHAGQDERAGVYLLAPEPGRAVLRVDERAECRRIYRCPVVDVGREEDVRFADDGAFDDDVTGVAAFQFQR